MNADTLRELAEHIAIKYFGTKGSLRTQLTDEISAALVEALLEEARWLEQFLHNGHTRDCTYDNATGDEGDYCSCGMAARRAEVRKHIADLERQAASVKGEVGR